jgi:hypothetical protein
MHQLKSMKKLVATASGSTDRDTSQQQSPGTPSDRWWEIQKTNIRAASKLPNHDQQQRLTIETVLQ